MFKSIQMLAIVVAAAAIFTPAAHAQTGGVNIAVIDISHIFKNHGKFTALADKIKADIKAFEDHINSERAKLTEERKKLDLYKPGTPDYKRVEETLARMTSELQVQAALKRKTVLESEAQLYYDTYGEIQGAIRTVAQKYNIGLVLRFNSKPIDPNDRSDVLNGINRPVVYQNGIDITQPVMDLLPKQQAAVPGAKKY